MLDLEDDHELVERVARILRRHRCDLEDLAAEAYDHRVPELSDAVATKARDLLQAQDALSVLYGRLKPSFAGNQRDPGKAPKRASSSEGMGP
jgi:uncharacterized coiled-coil protein SlyX